MKGINMSKDDRRELEAIKCRNEMLHEEVVRLSLQVSELAAALKKYIECAANCPCPDRRPL